MKVLGVVNTPYGRQVAVSDRGNIDGYAVEQRGSFYLVRLAVSDPGTGMGIRDWGTTFDCDEHRAQECWHMEAVRQWKRARYGVA